MEQGMRKRMPVPKISAAATVEEDDELWFPDGCGWYAGEPVPMPSSTLTTDEQLERLDHPLFTGCFPECG